MSPLPTPGALPHQHFASLLQNKCLLLNPHPPAVSGKVVACRAPGSAASRKYGHDRESEAQCAIFGARQVVSVSGKCRGQTVGLTLWGEAAEVQGAELEQAEDPIVSVSTCRVGDFNGGPPSALSWSCL